MKNHVVAVLDSVETLLDDRSERAGVKIKDADLIGIPVRVVVGKKLGEGIVEYKERKMENAVEIALTDAVSKVTEFVKANIECEGCRIPAPCFIY